MSFQAIPWLPRRCNKSNSRQESLNKKPIGNTGNERRLNSKDKSMSFTNTSFMNNSQLDNQRSNSQNAYYGQDQYIEQAFTDRDRMNQNILFQGSQQIFNQINQQRKENKSPLTSRPSQRFQEIKQKPMVMQDLYVNKTKSIEEYKQREMMLLQKTRTLEKESHRLQDLVQKEKSASQKDQQDQINQKNVQRLQDDIDNLEFQMLQLHESLDVQKVENALLKKYVSTHHRSDQKNLSTRHTTASVNSSSGYKKQKTFKEYLPSYMVALKFTS